MEKFGEALDALKQGKKVCRNNWNGKGMWLILLSKTKIVLAGRILQDDGHATENPTVDFKSLFVTLNDTESTKLLDCILMKTVDDTFVPWLASQTDVLAEDWVILD
jgi:hypothetical protein